MLRLKGNIPFSPGGSSGENGSPNEKEKIPYDPTETYENPMTNPPSTQPSPRLVGFTRSFVPTGVPTISSSPTETPTQMPSTTPSVSPTDELQSIEAKSMQILTLETTPYKEKMDDTMIGIFEDATLQFVKDNIPSFPSSSTIIIDTCKLRYKHCIDTNVEHTNVYVYCNFFWKVEVTLCIPLGAGGVQVQIA